MRIRHKKEIGIGNQTIKFPFVFVRNSTLDLDDNKNSRLSLPLPQILLYFLTPTFIGD